MAATETATLCSCSRSPRQGGSLGHIGRSAASLSEREVEVIYTWIMLGSKQEAARRLFISYSTVATHIERAREKYAELDRKTGDKTSLLLRLLEDGYLRYDRGDRGLRPRRVPGFVPARGFGETQYARPA